MVQSININKPEQRLPTFRTGRQFIRETQTAAIILKEGMLARLLERYHDSARLSWQYNLLVCFLDDLIK